MSHVLAPQHAVPIPPPAPIVAGGHAVLITMQGPKHPALAPDTASFSR